MAEQPLPCPADITTPIHYGARIQQPASADGACSLGRWPVVWLIPCGHVPIDPKTTKVADGIIVYSMYGGGRRPEKTDGRYTTYDTKLCEPRYSPLCRHDYVIIPRDYQPQTLRSKDEVLRSGYAIMLTDE